jgi:2-dehydropantoate 2-reductase
MTTKAGETKHGMKIGILGAGALGGLYGAYLTANNEDVVLLDVWEEHVTRINETGLRVEQPNRDDIVVRPSASTNTKGVNAVDVLFLFVKSYHTKSAMNANESLYNDETTVVTLQNGLLNMEYIQEYVPSDNVVGGATTMGSSMEGPGHVLHTGWGDTKIGGNDADRVETVTDLLTDAGIETTAVDDPRAHIWAKQFVSVGIKPVAALTGLLDGPLSDHRESTHVMNQLVEEAVAVAESKGIEILGDPVAETHHNCQVNYDTMSSMLEDVRNERPTEIDQINGAIVEYANEEGVDVPYNQMATNLVKAKERSYSN